MDFNNLKNFCEFINCKEWQAESIAEDGLEETKRLFGEHLFNLMLEAGVDEKLADDISDVLAEAYIK